MKEMISISLMEFSYSFLRQNIVQVAGAFHLFPRKDNHLWIIIEGSAVSVLHIFSPSGEKCKWVELLMTRLVAATDQLLIIEELRGELLTQKQRN